MITIRGANGGGKTTLLRTLIGLTPPLSGRVHRPRTLRVAYVPQQLHVKEDFPLTVAESVVMGLPRGTSRADGQERVRDALRCVNLSDRSGGWLFALSVGQRQRAFIARALVARAAILALDEPTASLDDDHAERVQDLLKSHQDRGGVVLMVTHDQRKPRDDARELVIENGTLTETRKS